MDDHKPQMRTAKEAGEYLEQIVKQRGKTAEDLAVLLNTTEVICFIML